jgi:hypothetical protein
MRVLQLQQILSGNRKYSETNTLRMGSATWPSGVDVDLVAASMATSSWHRHTASLNCYKKFCVASSTKFSWPIQAETARKFTMWAIRSKKLSADTVKAVNNVLIVPCL